VKILGSKAKNHDVWRVVAVRDEAAVSIFGWSLQTIVDGRQTDPCTVLYSELSAYNIRHMLITANKNFFAKRTDRFVLQ
jgi:hypothetical protein